MELLPTCKRRNCRCREYLIESESGGLGNRNRQKFKKGIDIPAVICYNNIIREGQGPGKAVVMYYDSFDCEVTVEEFGYGSATFEVNEEDFEDWDNEPNDYDLEYDYTWG